MSAFFKAVDGDCSHEINRLLLLGRKAMTNLDSRLKSRDITLLTATLGALSALMGISGVGRSSPLLFSHCTNIEHNFWFQE